MGDGAMQSLARKSLYSSIYPAVQNLLLACRAYGLGACLTTLAPHARGADRASPRASRERRDRWPHPDRVAERQVRSGQARPRRRDHEPQPLRASLVARSSNQDACIEAAAAGGWGSFLRAGVGATQRIELAASFPVCGRRRGARRSKGPQPPGVAVSAARVGMTCSRSSSERCSSRSDTGASPGG